MAKLPLSIIDFVTHLKLLEPGGLSLSQRTLHEAIYGLELDQTELEVYRRATGREICHPREQHEATIIVGRRGGKTSRVGALIAVYEAFRGHALSRGERAHVLLIAPVTKQAQIAFNFIRSYILGSPILAQAVVKVRKSEIELRNGITIACYPCSYITLRGISVVCAICDEMAFWRHEETAANPEDEVIDALRPAMATFPNAKLIKISTPYRKEGILWREYQQRAELEHLVWQLPSREMNPTISPNVLEKERQRSEEKFRREYGAEFTDSIVGWITPEILDPCIMRDCRELPRVSNAAYVAAVDPAFKENDFALVVLHRSGDGTITVDHVARWAGTKKAPLGFEMVCAEIHRSLKKYGLNCMVGDQYCAAVIRQHFCKLGVHYKEFAFDAHTRADLFGNLKHLMVQRKLALVEEPELLRQLRNLEEQKAPNGNIEVRPGYGGKDDLAVAVAWPRTS